MTVNTINIVGQVLPPTGVPDTRSRVFFVMTGYDTDADDDAVIYPVPGKDDEDGFPIASDGTIDVDLWPNQEGERNTLYRVEVKVHQLNRPVRVPIASISVPNTGGPYNLNDLLGVEPPPDATVEEYIAQLAAAAAAAESAADRAEAALPPVTPATVSVPSDHATLTDAINAYLGFGGGYVTVNIESGTTISEQVTVDGNDVSFIRITSDDAVVAVDRSALTVVVDVEPNDGSSGQSYPFMCGKNGAKLPRIGCLFEMDSSGTAAGREGILLIGGSSVNVDPDCGVDSAGGQGLYGYGAGSSNVSGAVFTNAGNGWSGNGRGVWWRWSDHLHANYITCGGATWTGFQVQSGTFSALNGSAQNCGHYGFRARGGATGSARGFDGSNASGHGANINEGASVELTDSTFTRCGETDSEPAVLVESATADLGGATISGQFNGVVECRSGHIAGVPSSINANAAGGSPNNEDLRVTNGGQITGDGYFTAGYTTNVPYNSSTAAGIIRDEGSPIGAATISSGEITVTHAVMSIAEESPSLRNVTTANLPRETPDGTEITFFAIDNGDPITMQGDASGNILFNNNATLTIDNADPNSNTSVVTYKRTTAGIDRLYEKGYHQR